MVSLKTERFEMRLDDEVLTRVDKWRGLQYDVPSRSESMRRLVEIGLTATSRDSVQLSDGEKLIIVMLRDVYKHMKMDRGEIDPDFISEVIWGGHYWAPRWEMQGMFHDHADDPREVREVVNILDMWDLIERGHEKLPKKDKDRVEKDAEPFGKHVKFMGFDGNNEGTHMSIARFLVEKMGRFQRFKERDLNSHMPSVGTYRRMLSVFEPMRKALVGGDLNATQIIAILKAKVYAG